MPTPAETVDLGQLATAATGSDGVHWTLPDGWDLNVNLVHLDGGGGIAAHRNDEVDVVLIGIAGCGTIAVDGTARTLGPGTLVAVPRGAERSVHAEADGLAYVSAHRRRSGPSIGPPRRTATGAANQDEGGDPPCWAHLDPT